MNDEVRKINVNEADVEALSQIPGIAENLARRIIEYRETVHPFEEVIELAAVPGISERMVREFADWVTVEPVEMMERTASMPGITLEPKAEPVPAEEAAEEEAIFEFVTETEAEEAEPEETKEAFVESVVEDVEEVEEETATSTTDAASTLSAGVPQPITITPIADEEDTAKLPPLIEPKPEPQPRPVSQPSPGPSQGRVLAQILLGSILGAAVGVVLTLAILAALNNGTLSFNRTEIRQIQSEIQDAQRVQSDLQQTVDNMDTEFNANLGAVATRAGDLFLQQQETDTAVNDIMSGMRQTNANVTELQAVTNALDERLTTVAAAAETFNAFLDGLRGLLANLDGGTAVPETATPPATIEATPTTAATGETATAVPSPTSRPTRTPRPTATPIPLPTSTPGQQP
ncbi:MAG: helix-hairpin-helix domain-containing protein [Ardenticatenaceae bacterium]|nr:helix-hairpin-helix domain-containing protein [Ardenticatenaceae bacterium]MCB9446450.1 helix-hairpin-helix domain-containing protein [Ardenticatenaceae bacterium]